MKGGAAGGETCSSSPNGGHQLHFTGDFRLQVGAANNLLAALLDNHIHQGTFSKLILARITWKRVVDMNDRQLRHIVNGLQDE